MSRRYAVCRGASDEPDYYTKWQIAEEWVRRGMAVVIGPNKVRMVQLRREVAVSSELLSCAQSDAYELSAIDPNRHLVQGGRVNGHRLGEGRFKRHTTGAKIGHQP